MFFYVPSIGKGKTIPKAKKLTTPIPKRVGEAFYVSYAGNQMPQPAL